MDYYALRLISDLFGDGIDINRYISSLNGRIALKDSATCLPIRSREDADCDNDCNMVIARVESRDAIAVIDFNGWIQDAPHQKCDYILFDTGTDKNRFALCELTCSLSKYVDDRENGKSGKRAKALSQMMEIWQMIISANNPLLSVYILQFRNKTAIFGWRERKLRRQNKATQNMRTFTRIPGGTGITVYPQNISNFVFSFVQVKYPSVFIWD